MIGVVYHDSTIGGFSGKLQAQALWEAMAATWTSHVGHVGQRIGQVFGRIWSIVRKYWGRRQPIGRHSGHFLILLLLVTRVPASFEGWAPVSRSTRTTLRASSVSSWVHPAPVLPSPSGYMEWTYETHRAPPSFTERVPFADDVARQSHQRDIFGDSHSHAWDDFDETDEVLCDAAGLHSIAVDVSRGECAVGLASLEANNFPLRGIVGPPLPGWALLPGTVSVRVPVGAKVRYMYFSCGTVVSEGHRYRSPTAHASFPFLVHLPFAFSGHRSPRSC